MGSSTIGNLKFPNVNAENEDKKIKNNLINGDILFLRSSKKVTNISGHKHNKRIIKLDVKLEENKSK